MLFNRFLPFLLPFFSLFYAFQASNKEEVYLISSGDFPDGSCFFIPKNMMRNESDLKKLRKKPGHSIFAYHLNNNGKHEKKEIKSFNDLQSVNPYSINKILNDDDMAMPMIKEVGKFSADLLKDVNKLKEIPKHIKGDQLMKAIDQYFKDLEDNKSGLDSSSKKKNEKSSSDDIKSDLKNKKKSNHNFLPNLEGKRRILVVGLLIFSAFIFIISMIVAALFYEKDEDEKVKKNNENEFENYRW